jgi:tetratricopeptide (TPR) repeat protein
MLRKDMTKVEIEKELEGKGDYVLIDNITRFLKENIPTDVRRFVYLKLVVIYERRNMFFEAANIYGNLSDIAISESDRNNYLNKEAQSYIQAGFFEKADAAITKMRVKELERRNIMASMTEFYKKQAELYEKEKRRNKAMKTYEKILTMNISEAEKNEINLKLMMLYRELGMIDEYMKMKNRL